MALMQPSSTITAATLAGVGAALGWLLVGQFYFRSRGITLDPEIVSLSTTFVSGLTGYFKKENVLPIQRPEA
jgi:hypothetical protein